MLRKLGVTMLGVVAVVVLVGVAVLCWIVASEERTERVIEWIESRRDR